MQINFIPDFQLVMYEHEKIFVPDHCIFETHSYICIVLTHKQP